ncbi:MAG: Fic/DOC family protein [Pseudomonadota bacterium]
MSKYQFNASDIYLPGTDIPKNRLGITEPEVLHQVEETLLQQAYQTFIAECEPDTRFDEAYFKSLHLRTFESLYEWAGAYRSVDMSKGDSMFCRANYLERESRRIFSELEQESFLKQAKDSTREKFAERLAYYQSELIALHPFYELNGRITRLFFDLIAVANGYAPIDYSKALLETTAAMNTYIQASIACVQQADNRMLQQIMLQGLNKLDATT